MTGFTRMKKNRERWLKTNGIIQDMNSQTPSTRVITCERFNMHLSYVQENMEILLNFYTAARFSRQKLKSYVGKQKTWNKITERITMNKDNPVIAFGNGTFKHNSRGLPTTPLKRIYTELKKKRVKVRLIDEFRTSITCSHCEGELPKKTRYWQVKVCNDICLTHWNRDVNAARNMKNIIKYMEEQEGKRPSCFTRGPHLIQGE